MTFVIYVEQNDILMPLATVRETILFAAETRLAHKSEMEKLGKVDSILSIYIVFSVRILL